MNLARKLQVDPEQALRKTNAKFRKRFAFMESRAMLPGASIAEMEALWQQAKAHDGPAPQAPAHNAPASND